MLRSRLPVRTSQYVLNKWLGPRYQSARFHLQLLNQLRTVLGRYTHHHQHHKYILIIIFFTVGNLFHFLELISSLLSQILIGIQRLLKLMFGVISFEGNIGAGKSTLLSLLEYPVIKQPVEQWLQVAGTNIIQKYYSDPKRWAFTFQINAIYSRSQLWERVLSQNSKELYLSERSPHADRWVFGHVMNLLGNFESVQYQIYQRLCNKMIGRCPVKAMVYLRCGPQICLERIKKRNREGEDNVTMQFLELLHKRHEQWIESIKDVPILTIDTSKLNIDNAENLVEVKKLFKEFIAKITTN